MTQPTTPTAPHAAAGPEAVLPDADALFAQHQFEIHRRNDRMFAILLVVQWVASRLKDEIGSIAKIVTDSFGRGHISAVDHTSMSFNCQGELLSILTPHRPPPPLSAACCASLSYINRRRTATFSASC